MPGPQVSPFDVNMAADAGYQLVVPYAHVTLEGIAGLVQDAIFSRGPKGAARTGLFIGGRDVLVADDMLERARKAMFPPFVVSLCADPSLRAFCSRWAASDRFMRCKPMYAIRVWWRQPRAMRMW